MPDARSLDVASAVPITSGWGSWTADPLRSGCKRQPRGEVVGTRPTSTRIARSCGRGTGSWSWRRRRRWSIRAPSALSTRNWAASRRTRARSRIGSISPHSTLSKTSAIRPGASDTGGAPGLVGKAPRALPQRRGRPRRQASRYVGRSLDQASEATRLGARAPRTRGGRPVRSGDESHAARARKPGEARRRFPWRCTCSPSPRLCSSDRSRRRRC